MKLMKVGACILLVLLIGFAYGRYVKYREGLRWESRIKAVEKWAIHGPGIAERSRRLYNSILEGGATDEVKWQSTQVVYDSTYKPDTFEGTEAQYQVKTSILGYSELSETCIEHYTGITAHIELSTGDLERLGQSLGSDERSMGGYQEYRGGGTFLVASTFVTTLTHGELARKWIEYLVGVDFEDKQSFEQWFEENRSRLAWDQQEGQFLLKRSP